MSELAAITIVYAGKPTNLETLGQTYPNINLMQGKEEAPVLFNHALKQPGDNILCFVTENESFLDANGIAKAASVLMRPSIKGVYSDNIFNGRRQYFPSYSQTLTTSNIIINTPFIIQRPNRPIFFNEKLKTLFYHDFLMKLGQISFLHHIAEPLFRLSATNLDVQEDINILKEDASGK